MKKCKIKTPRVSISYNSGTPTPLADTEYMVRRLQLRTNNLEEYEKEMRSRITMPAGIQKGVSMRKYRVNE